MSSTQLGTALAAVENCFQSWKHKTHAERAIVVNQAAALLLALVDDFAELETIEMASAAPRRAALSSSVLCP